MRLLTTSLVLSGLLVSAPTMAQTPAAHGNPNRGAAATTRRTELPTAADVHRARPSQATAQSGTGRVGQAAIPRTTVPSHAHAHSRLTRRETTPRPAERAAQRTKSAPQGNAFGHQPRMGEQHGLARGHLENGDPADPQRQRLRQRLAEIDRLRDEAVLRGDAQALAHADRLEQQARFDHAHTVAAPVPNGTPSSAPPATEPPVFTPGYGRLTAEQAHALHRDAKRPPESLPPGVPPSAGPGYGRLTAEAARQQGLGHRHDTLPTDAAAPDSEFTPGYGRLTAEQARARAFQNLPPVEPMPAAPTQSPAPAAPIVPPPSAP